MLKVLFGSPLTLLLLSLLCTCDRAQTGADTELIKGNIRYQEDNQILDVQVRVKREPGDSSRQYSAPRVFNFEMKGLPHTAAGSFGYRKPMSYPAVIPLDLPCGQERCPIDINFTPVYVDSFPASISRREKLTVQISDEPLAAKESLIFFFEPDDRSQPERIQLIGPTNDAVINLPKDAIETLAPGGYSVYLIKQQLQRDSTSRLKSSLQVEYITRARPITITE